MTKEGLLDEINSRMRELLVSSPARDLESNLRAMLAAGFNRLDLVTREEFDVQRKILARTREQLESLQARIEELESRLRAKD